MARTDLDPGTRTTRRPIVGVLVLAIAGVVAGTALHLETAASAAPPTPETAFVSGRKAIDRLGAELPAVAAAHRLDPGVLRSMLLTDQTLKVDHDGGLAYFEEIPPHEEAFAAAAAAEVHDGPVESPPVDLPEFQLESLPGAAHTIYLDFDGHTTTGTTWNTQFGVESIVSPPFDRDGDPTSWSALELQIIRDSWAVVAEDFAPWQVNVTTKDPGPEALRYTGAGDQAWGVRVVITKDTFAGCGCGGFAYIGSYTSNTDKPVFVFNSTFVGVSEAISHEVGHGFFLAHDGTSSGTEYYAGHDHDHGGPSWAPIMGVSYYRQITQWSRQEYSGANNNAGSANFGLGPDDFAIISNVGLGHLPIRVDDHGTFDSPTPLTPAAPVATGIIETRHDVDAFSFTTPAGVVSVDATPAPLKPNLDIELTLRSSQGTVIASSSPVGSLAANITTLLPAGTYVAEVTGAGVGNPFLNPPTGYTDYGSLGRFTISWSVEASEPPDTTPPAAPTGLSATTAYRDVELTWNPNVEDDLAGYVVQRDSGGGFTDIRTVTTTTHVDPYAPGGTHLYRVLAVDQAGNRSDESNVVSVVVDGPSVSLANGDENVAGSVTGSFTATSIIGGAVQTITEQPSDGKPTTRHDLLEQRWTFPALVGNHTLSVHASTTDAGDADDGVWFEVSDDAERWSPVLHVPAGTEVSTGVDIGYRSGTIHVRVRDTDRSIGQHLPDSVSVDYLAIEADGEELEPPEPTALNAEIATFTWGSLLGRQYGVVVAIVRDDLANAIADAAVEVWFGPPFATTATATTGFSGVAHLATSWSIRKPAVSACVVTITGPLPYAPGSETC